MLVLTRKKGEELIIGDNITVTVLEVRGNRVKLGVQAPREVGVWRNDIAVVTASQPEDRAESTPAA